MTGPSDRRLDLLRREADSLRDLETLAPAGPVQSFETVVQETDERGHERDEALRRLLAVREELSRVAFPGGPTNPEEERLARTNRQTAERLFRATNDLLEAWRAHGEETRALLEELRQGRRLIGSALAGRSQVRDLDLRR